MGTKLMHQRAPNQQSVSISRRIPNDNGLSPAVTKLGSEIGLSGAQKLEEHGPDALRRERISRILANLGKSALDYALNASLKGRILAHKAVKEGLGVSNPLLPSNGKEEDMSLLKEKMQEKIEKMQEEMNSIKQQFKTSTKHTKELESFRKLPNGLIKESSNLENKKKKVFIRSRL